MRRRFGVVGTSRSVSMLVFYVSSEACLAGLRSMGREKPKKRKVHCNNAYGKTGLT